jgi:hypothetical protein
MAHSNEEVRTIRGRKGGGQLIERVLGSGKVTLGSPRSKEDNPIPIFGTLGVVR